MATKKVATPPAPAAKKPTNTALAKVPPSPSKELAVASKMSQYLIEDAGSGLENITTDDLAVPRLAILQSLSPQVQKRDPDYIEGAEVGMIYDSVSGKLYDGQEGIEMLLVSYRRANINWWPRGSSKGKGFIKDYGADPEILKKTTQNDKYQNLLPDGSEIVPTAEYFGFILTEDGGVERVLVPMAKTQLIKSRKLNTIVSSYFIEVEGRGQVRAPLYYRTYIFKTKPEENDKGSWFGWDITPGRVITDIPNGEKLYEGARMFRNAVAAGTVKVADPVAGGDDGGGGKAVGDDTPM